MRLSIKNDIMQYGRFGSMAKTGIFFGVATLAYGQKEPKGNLSSRRGQPAPARQQNASSGLNRKPFENVGTGAHW